VVSFGHVQVSPSSHATPVTDAISGFGVNTHVPAVPVRPAGDVPSEHTPTLQSLMHNVLAPPAELHPTTLLPPTAAEHTPSKQSLVWQYPPVEAARQAHKLVQGQQLRSVRACVLSTSHSAAVRDPSFCLGGIHAGPRILETPGAIRPREFKRTVR
jgi:hypothetical protein